MGIFLHLNNLIIDLLTFPLNLLNPPLAPPQDPQGVMAPTLKTSGLDY